MVKSKAYYAWGNIKNRCLNPKNSGYYRYGALGITVCQRWIESFDNFLADMGQPPSPLHSIDRIDVRGNYEPGNCRWATASEQANNKRTTRIVVAFGRAQSMSEWAKERGIGVQTLWHRLFGAHPMPAEEALTLPMRTLGNRAPKRKKAA